MANLNIAIAIAAKDQGASGVISGLTKTLGGLGSVASGVLTAGLGLAVGGLAALGAGLGLALSEAAGAQEVMAQTEAVIRSTGGAAGMTAGQIADLATQLSLQSRFSDDAIQKGENLLLTFTNIGKDVFPDATQAMVDMATAMGTDVSGGAVQLGKALNDPIAGISALSRVGVSFTEDQKKVIEQLVATGDVAGAQRIILAELSKEFGGSAAAAAGTFAGKLDVTKNRLLNVAEAIGGPLLDFGMQLIDRFLMPAVPLIEGLGTTFATFMETILGGGDLGTAFDNLAGGIYRAFGPEAGLAVMQFGDYFTGTLIPGIQSLVAFVVENLPLVQATFQTVWTWIVENSELIKGALIAIGVVLGGAAIIGGITAVAAAVATLVSPVGLVVAAAALLGAAWAGNWGGIRDTLTAFWTTTGQPLFAQLQQWLQVNIPIALQTLSNFWTTVLLPAITAVWTWLTTVWWPLMFQLRDWLAVNIPLALQALSDFWTGTLLPAINDVWAWMTGTLFPALSDLWTWLSTTLTAALQTLSDFWTGTLKPAIEGVWKWMKDPLFPFIESLVDLLDAVFGAALEGLAKMWKETLKPAIEGVWKFLQEDVFPLFKDMTTQVDTKFAPVFKVLGEAMDAVRTGAFALLKSALDGLSQLVRDLTGFFGGLAGAIRGVPAMPSVTGGGGPVPGFAAGGVFGPGFMMVGEQGRELLYAGTSGRVFNHADTERMVQGAGGGHVENHTHYHLEAHYGTFQDEGSVLQDLKLMTMLRPAT